MRVPLFDLRVLDQNLQAGLLGAFIRVLEHWRLFMGPEVEEFEEKIYSLMIMLRQSSIIIYGLMQQSTDAYSQCLDRSHRLIRWQRLQNT